MTTIADRHRPWGIHPFQAVFLAGALSLFLSALLADYAYWSAYHVQWSNFASWLLVGAMLMTSIALICEIIALVRGSRNFTYLLLLVATWMVGLFDALHHGRDAWAIMPMALVLSAIASAMVLVATWLGFSRLRAGGLQ